MAKISEPRLDEFTDKWVINIFYDDGNLKGSKEYDTEELALIARDQLIDEEDGKQEKAVAKQEKKELVEKSTFLENAFDENELNDIIPQDNIFGGESEESLQEKIDEHKTAFEEEEEKCIEEAKNLLLQAAQVYLDGKFIQDSEYLQYKLKLEEKGLAGLVFQLNITRRAVFKLSEKIATDEATPRHFEVLTGMNRVILDITKYQHEHLGKLEEAMKKYQVDATEAEIRKGNSNSGDGEDDDAIDVEGTVIDTRNRKALLSELNGIIQEAQEQKIPKSRNTKLHDDDPNVGDVDYEEPEDENIGSDDLSDGGGLTTWEDESEDKP